MTKKLTDAIQSLEPRSVASVHFAMRMPAKAREALEELASTEERSVSDLVREYIAQGLKAHLQQVQADTTGAR